MTLLLVSNSSEGAMSHSGLATQTPFRRRQERKRLAWRAPVWSGAPRPIKMGTARSPCRYDAGARARSNRQICDGPRSCTTPHRRLSSRSRAVVRSPFDSGHVDQSRDGPRILICARACLGTARYAHSWLYEPGVLTTSFMSKRLTPLNGLGTLSILPVPVALA